MVTLKRRKTLHFPTDVTTPVAESLAFNHDSKGIAVLSHEPDAFLTVFYFDKAETVISGRVASGNQKNMLARFVSCNLSDTGLVAVCGMVAPLSPSQELFRMSSSYLYVRQASTPSS